MRIWTMSYLKMFFLSCFIIIISIVIYSCGASHQLRDDLIQLDDEFNYAQIKNNGIIIAGISSQLIKFTNEQRMHYSTMLSNEMLKSLKEAHMIHIVNPLQLMNKTGKYKYLELMNNYDIEKTLQTETMQFIRDSVPDKRYILFGYIENENIVDQSSDERVKNEEGKEEIETEYQKTYLLTIGFHVYDLFTQKMVMNDVIYNQAEQTETRTTSSGCVSSCMENIFQTILFGEPAEIDREEVLAKIYEKFAKDLVAL